MPPPAYLVPPNKRSKVFRGKCGNPHCPKKGGEVFTTDKGRFKDPQGTYYHNGCYHKNSIFRGMCGYVQCPEGGEVFSTHVGRGQDPNGTYYHLNCALKCPHVKFA